MTDQELAQAMQDRLLAEESAAKAAIDAAARKRDKAKAVQRLRVLTRAHGHMDKAWLALQPMMGLQPLSGGTPKPPRD